MSQPATYDKSEYQKRLEYETAKKQVGGQMQRDQKQAASVDALRAQQKELIAAGHMPGSLPVLSPNMSLADRSNAQARHNQLAGDTIQQSRDPQRIAASQLPKPVGYEDPSKLPVGHPDTPLGSLPPVQLRGSTPAEVAAFNANDAKSVSDVTTKAAAGKNTAVQTPYGSVSSRIAQKGEQLPAAAVGDSGVTREDPNAWQARVIAKYPQVGVAGSPENLAFIQQYRDAKDKQARNPTLTFDPEAHADSMFAPKPAVAVNAQGDTDPAVASRKDFLNRKMTKPGQNQNVPTRTEASDQQIAQDAAKAGAPIGNAIGAIGDAYYDEFVQPLKDVGNYATGLVKGVMGSTPPGATPPAPPSPVAPSAPLWGHDTSPTPAINTQPVRPWGPLSSPQPPAAAAMPPKQPTSASTGSGGPDSSGLASSDSSEFNGFNANDDNAAFASNPSEAAFKKKLRTPMETDWMTA